MKDLFAPRRVGKPAASDARSLAWEGARSARPRSACAASGVRRGGPSATARSGERRCPSNRARRRGQRCPSHWCRPPLLFRNGRRRRGGARAQRVTVVVGRMMAAFRERRSERRRPQHRAVAKPSRLGTGLICRRPRLCEDEGGTKSGQSRNLRRESPHAQSRNAASQSTRFVTVYAQGSRSEGPGRRARAERRARCAREGLGSLAAWLARDRRTRR